MTTETITPPTTPPSMTSQILPASEPATTGNPLAADFHDALPEPYGPEVLAIWAEVIGSEIDPGQGFLANGGDSFSAVNVVGRIFDVTGREVDYVDLLEADSIAELCARLPGPSDAA